MGCPSSHSFENVIVIFGQGYVGEHIFDHHPNGDRRVEESDLLVIFQLHTLKAHDTMAVWRNEKHVQRTKIKIASPANARPGP